MPFFIQQEEGRETSCKWSVGVMDEGACRLSAEQEKDLFLSAERGVTVLESPPKFVLGSQSPSRKAVLTATGATFDVVVPDIDEKAIGRRGFDSPTHLVRRIAIAKADAIQRECEKSHPHAVLLTGDQVVLFEGAIREKPRDRAEAREFIEGYSRSPVGTAGAICLHDSPPASASSAPTPQRSTLDRCPTM